MCIKNISIWSIYQYKNIRKLFDVFLVSAFGMSFSCKHSPSCSEYAIMQIQKYGTMRGFIRGIRRLLSCYLKKD